MPSHFQVECLDCGYRTSFSLKSPDCPRCGSEWREARYDYAALGAVLPDLLAGRPFDLWRYAELLPLAEFGAGGAAGLDPARPTALVTLGEGGTPLYRATNLSLMLGHPHLYIKDERQGPTASFKDRQAALAVAGLKEAGVTEMVVASTGNVAIAYSAYCARAGIKLWAFVTSLVPAEKMREVALYGTQVVKVSGTYDQAKKLAADFARQRNFYFDRGVRGVLSVESMKTIAFEAAEQLGRALGPQARLSWRAPDWYVQSVSGGIGPLGVMKGFAELKQMGLVEHLPALAAIQTEGCAPMAQAFRAGRDVAEPVRAPKTNIATLSTGDPGRTYTLLRQRTAGRRSVFDSVTDDEAFRAMHILAKMEGIACEPAAAVAVAGVIKLIRDGVIAPEDVVVINCSGHTFPVEKEILGDGWERNVSVPETAEAAGPAYAASSAPPPQEGLLAALGRLDGRTRSIAIIEDNPDARRLLRRILQARGHDQYQIYEAENGSAGIELARRTRPDLILLDLMMPGMDGFAVLDSLKADERTAGIPVIVVTAKSLTLGDFERLSGRIESVLQKGAFLDDDLYREIAERLA